MNSGILVGTTAKDGRNITVIIKTKLGVCIVQNIKPFYMVIQILLQKGREETTKNTIFHNNPNSVKKERKE